MDPSTVLASRSTASPKSLGHCVFQVSSKVPNHYPMPSQPTEQGASSGEQTVTMKSDLGRSSSPRGLPFASQIHSCVPSMSNSGLDSSLVRHMRTAGSFSAGGTSPIGDSDSSDNSSAGVSRSGSRDSVSVSEDSTMLSRRMAHGKSAVTQSAWLGTAVRITQGSCEGEMGTVSKAFLTDEGNGFFRVKLENGKLHCCRLRDIEQVTRDDSRSSDLSSDLSTFGMSLVRGEPGNLPRALRKKTINPTALFNSWDDIQAAFPDPFSIERKTQALGQDSCRAALNHRCSCHTRYGSTPCAKRVGMTEDLVRRDRLDTFAAPLARGCRTALVTKLLKGFLKCGGPNTDTGLTNKEKFKYQYLLNGSSVCESAFKEVTLARLPTVAPPQRPRPFQTPHPTAPLFTPGHLHY